VRYADDIVCGFEHEEEAKAFLSDLKARMEAFALSLHPQGRVSLPARNQGAPAPRLVRSALRFSPTRDACVARSGLRPEPQESAHEGRDGRPAPRERDAALGREIAAGSHVIAELRRLGGLQKHLFTESHGVGSTEYAKVLVAITDAIERIASGVAVTTTA